MAQKTKRPQNKCKSCGETWYPRGTDKSRKCPACGKADVVTVSAGAGATVLAVLIIAAISVMNKSDPVPSAPSHSPEVESAPVVATVVPALASAPLQSDPTPDAITGFFNAVGDDGAAASLPQAQAQSQPEVSAPTQESPAQASSSPS